MHFRTFPVLLRRLDIDLNKAADKHQEGESKKKPVNHEVTTMQVAVLISLYMIRHISSAPMWIAVVATRICLEEKYICTLKDFCVSLTETLMLLT